MPTLLLRFKAPMMSWGYHSRFTIRDSATEPTKSAVIGLLCAALGRPREMGVSDLVALRMGVRIDREGVLLKDYHTIQDAVRSSGKPNQDGVISIRYYVADGDYLVGLEGERETLVVFEAALRQPVWPLYFGRKSFVPSRPVLAGLRDTDLLEALRSEPAPPDRKALRYVLESAEGTDIRQDVPLDWLRRSFGNRAVVSTLMPVEEIVR
jgi:CRISPR system Cascade subunit CasD